VLACVELPGSGEPVPEAVLDRLHPEERRVAEGLRGYRQESFVGGRLAAAAALDMLGHPPAPVGLGARGEPVSPQGVTLSITHKRHIAAALAARALHGVVGVDLEDLAPPREGIGKKVLSPSEQAVVEALPPERRWTATVTRFAIKEAIYKALAPRLGRYIGFEEALLIVGMDGQAEVELRLDPPGPPVAIDARYGWLGEGVLATVRATWAPAAPNPSPGPVASPDESS
jgi:4'-phosphopantetheinyl transferase EntD